MTDARITDAQQQDLCACEESKTNVIQVLNKARSMELLSIHQYMQQHYDLSDKDYGKFAANLKLIAIDEMRHAEEFAERIKELDGEPCTELSGRVIKGQDVKAVFPYNDNLEIDTMKKYNEFLKLCRDNGDGISARLFEDILKEEQEHENYFKDSAEHIEELGNSYLSKIAGTSSETGLGDHGFAINGKLD